ncbi:hypothetical protein LWI29_037036 [Acer saccharum]|uniref:Uncharacterized protein n=1 Tax=Acer saccharum TaxID=4024 RepID=A0AA39S5K8_ACESA|nr:hypothetical protein LWI29_037036 [Acer saccharum]
MESSDVFLKKMAIKMYKKYNKYWGEFSVILAIDLILDPRYKMMFVDFAYKKVYGIDSLELDNVWNKLLSLFNEYTITSMSIRGSSSTLLPSSSGGGDTIIDTGSDIFTINIMQYNNTNVRIIVVSETLEVDKVVEDILKLTLENSPDARVQLLNSKADQSYGDYTINPLSPTPLPSHDKFPPIYTNPPPSTAQSPSPGPNPPHYRPSPPKHVPGPPQYTPSPPIYLPPVVNPSPSVPPPSPHKKPKSAVWCVAKPTVPDPIIQEAVDYACWFGADCKSIQPNGPCFQPNTLFAHASYAFNSYWQNTKVSGGTCDFGGTAMLVTVDPKLIKSIAYSFRNMVLLIVNYDGQWEDGQFNPKAVFFLSVTVKETLKTLAEKICSRFGLNSDEVEFKISTRIDGSIVEMIYDLDLQIFVLHNKENPKCYVSVFHKQLRSLVDQLTVTRDLKSKCTFITIGCTGDQACSLAVSSSGYRSTTGSNEFVPSGFLVDESKTPPSIRKSIFPQSPLGGTVSKKSANRSNHGNYVKDEKVHCPTVVTAEDEEGGMGCSANINSPLCPCSNEISPQDLPLRPTHDDNPLHLVDLVGLSASGINKNLSSPEHELKLRRRSGRQRKSIKYNQETCSNCSEKGHNKSGCRKPAFDASGPTKPPRTCSICHRPGHNRQTCPSGY